MKIPFNVKFKPQIESGEYKVETRSEMPVRIICWDCRNRIDMTPRHIIALIDAGPDEEICVQMADDGCFYNDKQEDGFDLFLITPEPELSEFEQEVCTISNLCLNLEMVDEIKSAATKCLTLARKELQPEFDAEIEKAYKNADEVMYNKGKEDAWRGIELVLKAEYDKGVIAGERQALKTIPNDEDMKAMLQLEYEKGKADALKSLLDNLPDEVYSAERWEEGYAEAINDAIAKIKAL